MSEKLGYDCHAEHGFSVLKVVGEITTDFRTLIAKGK